LTLLPAENAQWRGICLLFVGLEGYLNGQLRVARQELLQGLELNKVARNSYGILDTLLLLGRVCAEQGALRQALHYYQQALATLDQMPMSREMAEMRKGRALAGMGRLELEWNRLENAERYAAEAFELSHTSAEETLRVESALLLAKIDQVHGKFEEAQERLHALMTQTRNPHALAEIQSAQAHQALMAGDLATVQRWSGTQAGYPLPHIQEEADMLLNARLHLAEGEPSSSLRLLYEWQPDARAGGRTRSEIEMLVITSQAANTLGDIPCAKQALVQALSMAQPEGYQRLFLDHGDAVADLLRSVLREIKEKSLVAYIHRLLLAFAEEATGRNSERSPENASEPLDAAILIEPLSSQERRVLRLLAADLSNPEIAEELVVSLNTVKTHVKNIYSKLDVHSRDEAREMARQLNLI
jgi:LuxR family maltose regulon positive regulatory protein